MYIPNNIPENVIEVMHSAFMKVWLQEATKIMLPQEAATLYTAILNGGPSSVDQSKFLPVVAMMLQNGSFKEALKTGLQELFPENGPLGAFPEDMLEEVADMQVNRIKQELGMDIDE